MLSISRGRTPDCYFVQRPYDIASVWQTGPYTLHLWDILLVVDSLARRILQSSQKFRTSTNGYIRSQSRAAGAFSMAYLHLTYKPYEQSRRKELDDPVAGTHIVGAVTDSGVAPPAPTGSRLSFSVSERPHVWTKQISVLLKTQCSKLRVCSG